MLASDAVSVAVYASVPVAAWCGVLTVAQLIAVRLIAGAASVFFDSAYQVPLPGVVEEADLTEGNAKLLGSQQVAQAAGPVTGLPANAVSFAVSFCCLSGRWDGGSAPHGTPSGTCATCRSARPRTTTRLCIKTFSRRRRTGIANLYGCDATCSCFDNFQRPRSV